MRTLSYGKVLAEAAVIFFMGIGFCYAAEAPANNTVDVSLTPLPGRYTFVEGDASKFRALHWMDDGYAMGVEDFTLSKQLESDVTLESQGHVIPEDGDYRGFLHLTKEDYGYINFDYDQFRSYYGNGGGFYRPFDTLNQVYTDKALGLNNGKFSVEAGLTKENMPNVVVNYTREFKIGTKSRLDWASVMDNVGGVPIDVPRKIAPSWQHIHQIVDSFGAKISNTTNGFNWKAEQKWKYARSDNLSEEKQVTALTGPDTADAMITDQTQQPRQDIITTILGVNRWFQKDTIYVSSGYRFQEIHSRELDNLVETDGNRVPANFPDPDSLRQWRNAFSDTHYDGQTWVGSVMTRVFDPLSIITSFQAETIHRRSESTTPWDDAPAPGAPDGIIDHFEVANNQQKIMHYGESVSLRYSGIPRVSLYNDYEFEQIRNNLYANYTNSANNGNPDDDFQQQTLNHNFRGTETLGAQWVPGNHVTMTLQGRYRNDETRYDRPVLVDDFLDLIDAQTTETSEAMARIAWKPCQWFQPSFRYQLMDRKYQTVSFTFDDDHVETAQISNVYTWDLTSQLLDDLVVTSSFSFQDGKIITPARYNGVIDEAAATVAIPTFNYDSYTALFSIDYALTKDLMLLGLVDYTRAANYNDFTATGMPYGADFHKTDLTLGLSWKPKKDLTVEPKYAWYQYRTNGTEIGNYNAQVISLEAKVKW